MRYFLLLIALAAPVTLWAGWESETVAEEGNVGEGCALAADRWGRLHISFVDWTTGEVKYATYAGSSWEFETIASDVDVRGLTAIDLDAFDRPHVVFSDEKAGELTYAYRTDTKWVTEKIADGTDNLYVSIHAWGSGPHVSYAKVGLITNIRYAYRDDGGWHTEALASGGEFNKLFLDNEQRPHVVFHSSSKIKHAVREDAEWTVGDVAEGTYCDGTFGPDGKIHVSFTTTDNDALKHAVSSTGETWDIDEVTAAQGKPAVTQIILNGTGNVFISYYSIEDFDLHLVNDTGGSWKHELLTTEGDAGDPHSIAFDAGEYPVIAYYESVKEDLKLARYDPLTGVELTSFAARRTRDGVAVSWNVVRPESVVGYNLYRETAGAERARVNDAPIVGAPPFRYLDGAAPAEARNDYWLEVVAATGATRTFGPASVPPATKPGAFALRQNVPNPAAGATTFSFELPAGADVTLAVYDASGRRVATVAQGYFPPGAHDVPFANGLAPGVYVYRLETASNSAARKMVVTR